MSYYRQSTSPYKSMRVVEQQAIEDQLAIKKQLRLQGQNRRLSDELSILRLKLRKLQELQDKYDSLLKQNSMLAQGNEQLSAELADRRYELERLRSGSAQAQEREILKQGQLLEVSRSLEMEVELLKKERLESSKVYEEHIARLEQLLEEKVRENETLAAGLDRLGNEKELGEIRAEEERNKLRNELARTSHQKDRELELSKEKQLNDKAIELETLRRNHASQLAVLEDEVQKLRRINEIKMSEFQGQLIQNRNLKLGYEEELKKLSDENDALRVRMAKLQELSRAQVQNLQQKYSDLHVQGTSNLKQQHGNQVRILLDQLDRQKHLLSDKNSQIQQLIKDKRQLRQNHQQRQLQLTDQLSVLKQHLTALQDQHNEDAHAQNARITDLEDKMMRDAEHYHDRAKHFAGQIQELEGEGKKREANQERSKREWELQRSQILGERDNTRQELLDAKKGLAERTAELQGKVRQHEDYKSRMDKQRERLSKLLSETQLKNEQLQDKLDHTSNTSDKDRTLLTQQLQSYKRINEKLQSALQDLQNKYTSELGDLSTAHRSEVERLEAAHRLRIAELERTFAELRASLEKQLQLLRRELEDRDNDLKNLLEKYNRLEVHFKDPSKWVEHDPRACSSIFEAVKPAKESAVKIF